MFVLFQKFICDIVIFFLLLSGTSSGVNFGDTLRAYRARLNSVEVYENTQQTAVAQTAIYGVIKDFFESEPEEGKTEKKAIVIGYDGCRADALSLLDDSTGGITTLVNEGGKAVIAYCGSVNYPLIRRQDTSTAPGWCSMLTGVWSDKHGVDENDIIKSMEYPTLLTSLPESGTIDSSAFYVSWDGHFVSDSSTYHDELAYIKENNINSTWIDAGDDSGTEANIIADINKADCSDFIFSTLEYTDHIGHSTGFCPENPDYAQAFADAEQASLRIINAIKARPTYDTEDWLIIIASDHGGYNTGHGNMTIQERMMFFVTNKPVEYEYSYSAAGIYAPILDAIF